LDYEAKTQYFEPPQVREFELDRADKKKAAVDAVNMLGTLYYGDEAALAAAGDYFKGLNKDIMKLRRTPDGIQLVYKDGTDSTISFKTPSGQLKTQEEFIKSATELSGNADVSTALSRGGYRKGAFSQATAESVRTTASTGNPLADFNKYINNNINKDVSDNEDQTVSNLNQKYGKYGYSTKGTGIINSVIEISGPPNAEGVSNKKEFKLKSPGVAKQIADWMKGSANTTKIVTASAMGATEGTTGELD